MPQFQIKLKLQKWYAAYIVLAMICIFVAGFSLHINNRIIEKSEDNRNSHSEWNARNASFAGLANSTAQLNSIGNSAIDSADLETDKVTYAKSHSSLEATYRKAHSNLDSTKNFRQSRPITLLLQQSQTYTTLMTKEANKVFKAILDKNNKTLAIHITAMNQAFTNIIFVLSNLNVEVLRIQSLDLSKQQKEINQLRNYQLSMGGIILLVVLVLIIYGRRLSIQMHHSDNQRSTNIKRMQKHERYLSETLDASAGAVININCDNIIIDWNLKAEKTFGWTKEEIIGKNANDYLVPNSVRESHLVSQNNVLNTTPEHSFKHQLEAHAQHKDGHQFPVEISITKVTYEAEVYYSTRVFDISSRKEAEQSLIYERNRMELIFQSIGEGIYGINKDGRITFANNAAAIFLGWELEELIGKKHHFALHCSTENDLENSPEKCSLCSSIQAATSVQINSEVFRHKNGNSFEVELTANPLLDNCKNVGVVIVFKDISKQIAADVEQNRQIQILEANPDLVASFSIDGQILYVNNAGKELLDISEDTDLSTRNINGILPKSASETVFNEGIPKAYMEGTWLGETEIVSKDGTLRTVLQSIVKHDTDASGTAYYSTFMRDISDRKQAETDLVNARDMAEEATRTKSLFLATMSHEIRTPMNGVLGMAQILSNTNLDAEQRSYLDTIEDSGQLLLTIINDILDFSKIDADKLELEKVAFDLEQTAHDVCMLLQQGAREKNVEIIMHYHPACIKRVIGDPYRIRQIIMNLLSNAIKFTDKGNILLEINSSEPNESIVTVALKVKDTGIGMSPTASKNLFLPFTQADSTTTRQYGGTGLGLAICKKLVERMNGNISVQSEVGKGSSFSIAMELGIAENSKPLQRAPLAGIKILVVDDNIVNCNILFEWLRYENMDVTTTMSAEQALQQIIQADKAGTPFAMAIIDYIMPGMNGFQLASAIRSDPCFTDLALVLFTSAAQKHDVEKAKNLGFNAYLPKPIRSEVLLNTLSATLANGTRNGELITRHSLRESEACTEKNSNSLSGTLLLVEDVAVNRLVIESMLKALQLNFDFAFNGQEALDLYQKNHYDLILMDCQMPIMDGYQATTEIREIEIQSDRHIPIIALTANVMIEERTRCHDSGMDDFLAKPITQKKLFDMLETWLPKSTKTDMPQEYNENSPEESNEASMVKSMVKSVAKPVVQPELPLEDLIDYKRVDELQSLLKSNFVSLIASFTENTETCLSELTQAHATNNVEQLITSAHTLKGVSGNVGAKKLFELVKLLEADCKNGSTENLKQQLATLRSIFNQTNKILMDYTKSKSA